METPWSSRFAYPESPEKNKYTKEYNKAMWDIWNSIVQTVDNWDTMGEEEEDKKAWLKQILRNHFGARKGNKTLDWNKSWNEIREEVYRKEDKYRQLTRDAKRLDPDNTASYDVQYLKEKFENISQGMDRVKKGEWTPEQFYDEFVSGTAERYMSGNRYSGSYTPHRYSTRYSYRHNPYKVDRNPTVTEWQPDPMHDPPLIHQSNREAAYRSFREHAEELQKMAQKRK